MVCALLELQTDDCRFPVADRLFCAEPRREGSSYCAHHHARAYVAPGGRGFVSGRFLSDAHETVPEARKGTAESASATVNDPDTLLDRFVRAAAAARREAPQPVAVIAPIERPKIIVRRVAKAYLAPVSSDGEHATREAAYLADLARQNDKVVADIAERAERGINYAVHMRDRLARALDLSLDELLCKRRSHEIVLPRQFVMFCVCRGALKMSLPGIGDRVFAGFNHTTVLHAREKIEGMIANGTLPEPFASLLDDLCATDSVIAAAVRKARASNPGSESSTE